MRSTLLSVILGLSLVGCVTSTIGAGDDGVGGGDDGTGGGGDDGTGSGSGSNTPQPKLMVTTDNPTVNTELGAASMLTINLDSENFTGPVTLVATVTDDVGTVLPEYTVTFASSTVNMTGTASVPVVATLTTPTLTPASLTAKVKVDVTSTLGTSSVTSDVTVANSFTLKITENGNGQCVYPAAQNNAQLKVGTTVRFLNKFTTDKIVIHSNGAAGIPHENNAGTLVDQAYEKPGTQPGTLRWYCHAPGPNMDQMITFVQ